MAFTSLKETEYHGKGLSHNGGSATGQKHIHMNKDEFLFSYISYISYISTSHSPTKFKASIADLSISLNFQESFSSCQKHLVCPFSKSYSHAHLIFKHCFSIEHRIVNQMYSRQYFETAERPSAIWYNPMGGCQTYLNQLR